MLNEWQDISTAPKDGRRILLADLAENIEIGSWHMNAGHWIDDGEAGWINPKWMTHWMPLPEPPSC